MGFTDSSVGKESNCNAGDPSSIPGLGKSPAKGKAYPLQYSGMENSMDCIVHGVAKSWTRLSNFHFHLHVFVCMGFPCGLGGKESACSVGDLGSIPGLGRSPGEVNGYPLQYVGLENSMYCIVHGVAKSQMRPSDFHFQSI